MAKLRFRVELNKGGDGVSMSKLASVTQETEKFLEMLVSDIAIGESAGKWIARDFDNQSVDYNAEYVGTVTDAIQHNFDSALDFITAEKMSFDARPTRIRPATISQYANIAKSIDVDETIVFGLFNGNGDHVKARRVLSKLRSIELQQQLKVDDRIQYLGSVQGVIHSIVTEGKETSFKIRELFSDDLIKCNYNKVQYDQVVSALRKQAAVVHVEGCVIASRIAHRVLWMEVERVVPAVEYHEGDVDKFIGLFASPQDNTDKFN